MIISSKNIDSDIFIFLRGNKQVRNKTQWNYVVTIWKLWKTEDEPIVSKMVLISPILWSPSYITYWSFFKFCGKVVWKNLGFFQLKLTILDIYHMPSRFMTNLVTPWSLWLSKKTEVSKLWGDIMDFYH